MSSRPDLRLDWCSHEAAKYAVEHWHYSRRLPVSKLAKVGVWEDGRFIGAIIFGCGSAGVGSMGKTFGCKSYEVAELARVALTKHETPVTKIVAVAIKLLHRSMSGLRLIVSYADPEQGHIGGIYQGGNWTYTGRSAPDVAFIDKSGKRWHSRSVSATGVKTRLGKATWAPSPEGMQQVTLIPKYRYLMPLDDEMRNRVAPLAKPYPKRAGSIGSDVPAIHAGEGGVIPTPALHSSLDTVDI